MASSLRLTCPLGASILQEQFTLSSQGPVPSALYPGEVMLPDELVSTAPDTHASSPYDQHIKH